MDSALLLSYGIDYDKGLKNCMGNPSFYKKILSMFLEDPCFTLAKAAYQEGNRKELFSRIHELKGISGNAALAALYDATVPLVEILRAGNDMPEDLAPLFTVLEDAYHRACEGINILIAES